MKVYKFRSISDPQSIERIDDILRTGEFWCSRFWELNDPMEGYYQSNEMNRASIDQIFSEKSSTLICSLSRETALRNPLMWGYYANGFNGVAIETQVDESELVPITYSDNFQSLTKAGSIRSKVRTILSRKLKCWKHERETRFLSHDDYTGNQNRRIGEISGIVIGKSYPRALVNANVDNRWNRVGEYERTAGRLIRESLERGLRVRRASMRGGRVVMADVEPPRGA